MPANMARQAQHLDSKLQSSQIYLMELNRNDLIAFAVAAVVAATIWVIWLIMSATGELKAEHWLGFLGNVFGGGMTLLAALAAWLAVRGQNAEQRRAVEIHRRDAADLRLSAHMLALFDFHRAFDQTISDSNRNKVGSLQGLEDLRRSPEILSILIDPLLGRDVEAVASMTQWALVAANREVAGWGDRDDGRRTEVTYLLYTDITNAITRRRQHMRRHGVDSLAELKLVDVEHYNRYVLYGEPHWFERASDLPPESGSA